MSKITINSFREETNSLYQLYDNNFAGRARATRDLTLLDHIINRLEQLIEDARGDDQLRKTPAFMEIFESAIDSLQLYKGEKEAIEKIQNDPKLVELANASSKANRLFGVYTRHFAGQNRSTRDVRLLEDLILETEAVRADMERLASNGTDGAEDELSAVRSQIEMYKGEIFQIKNAQLSGSTDERISILASLANDQFKIYTDHFAGKDRISRRPELLERMIASLEEIRSAMRAIQETPGVTSPTNTGNINIVTDNLNMYREELEQILSARQSVSPVEMEGSLATAANNVMGDYGSFFAGQNRATRDLDRMSNLCDAMWEISRQMEALLSNNELEHNPANLDKVNENWNTYEREFVAIKEAIEAGNSNSN